ncbi:peptidylprolyl isomerase [bacterium]|nr:peptidylprolyl isomerase [bacterium]
MKRLLICTVLLAATISCSEEAGALVPLPTEATPVVLVDTDVGNFYILLHDSVNPDTVENFVALVEAGTYDGIGFHRVEKGHVIQAGCPYWNEKSRAGTGNLADAYISFENATLQHIEGAVGMARSRELDSAGSQFYVCLAPRPHLDGDYVVFGQVIAGMEVVHGVEVGTIIEHTEILTYGEFLEKAKLGGLGIRPVVIVELPVLELGPGG